MRAAIQQERRVEFNCEGIRFHDLRRWKIADKHLGGKLYGMNHDGSEKSDDVNNPKAFYKRTYYKSRTFNKKDVFMARSTGSDGHQSQFETSSRILINN